MTPTKAAEFREAMRRGEVFVIDGLVHFAKNSNYATTGCGTQMRKLTRADTTTSTTAVSCRSCLEYLYKVKLRELKQLAERLGPEWRIQ